jgi:uncharacterized membrane protein
MSLKTFHLVFIIAAIGLAIGFGCWLGNNYFSDGGLFNLLGAILSFAFAAGLVFYERYFLKKTKKLSYL